MLDPKSPLLRDFPPTRSYLVGISGGRDSVALLDLLVAAGYKKLIVCHLNHQLRGRAAAGDAEFVRRLAARHDLRSQLASTEVARLARSSKVSIEAAGRAARYSFFAGIAKKTRCREIFLAHHADDLVETFLINLFRGAGTAGLAGMREVSRRRVERTELTIVRPLLRVWRDEIDRHVQQRKLKFREDASNQDLAPLRNRVRRQIIPYLEKSIGRTIRQNIWRTATIMAEEENFFETLLPEELGRADALAIAPLREMDPAVQRRALHKWLRGGKISDVSFDLVERVRALLDLASQVAKTNLPGGRHARRKAGKLFLE